MSAPYIELHASSAFSFLDGASLPEEFAKTSAEYGMAAIALLDRDGVYGAPQIHLAAKKAGIQAHIGAEVTSITGIRYPLLAETRMFRVKGFTKHLIFYRPIKNGVEIIRVIHGARDIESLFEP